MSKRIVWIALVLLGCGFEPEGGEPMDPPPQYREWFVRDMECSGLQGNYDRIRWFVIKGHEFECPSGRCVGRWQDDHRIYIAEDWLDNELVVRHEMLHDLVNRNGHPDPPFGHGCPVTWTTWPGSQPTLARAGPGID